MKLQSLRITGFGRLADTRFVFGPGLNVIVGSNEAGKSTLASAIVASLYGLQRGEKERWRPWAETEYATVLTYETGDGATWEVHRAFDRDSKGLRVFDGGGNDVAARIGNGKALNPGDVHLQIPLDVFLQTACIRQGAVALDGERADAVSASLAQALDGGPKEDAAIGAIERLDEALRKFVGTQRAHKNNPLRKLRDDEAQQRSEVQKTRAALDDLATLRERIVSERTARDRDLEAAGELEQRTRALRAAHLRSRLAALADHRAELASLKQAHASYDDVANFPSERIDELDRAFHTWQSAERVAGEAQVELDAAELSDDEEEELAERQRDVGRLDNNAFYEFLGVSKQCESARAKAAAFATDAALARRGADEGRTESGLLLTVTGAAVVVDVGVAIAHLWVYVVAMTVVALFLGLAATKRTSERMDRISEAEAKQRVADNAIIDEQQAAAAVARVLEPLRISSAEELAALYERLVELSERQNTWRKVQERAQKARVYRDLTAGRFDMLAHELIPDVVGTRPEQRDVALLRAARKREREGLDASFAMLSVREHDILLGDDERAIRAELDALLETGVLPAGSDDATLLRTLSREREDLLNRAHAADLRVHSLQGELHSSEERIPDIAALDEVLAFTAQQIARLEAFERAVTLARDTIDARKDEAHSLFARRLEQYSLEILSVITGGRYGQIFLDPATLAINVRIPENGQIEPIDRLSMGTQDQIALVVRFATARMFAEGLETPPLLLDDPFAFWDAKRIERCLPVLTRGAVDTQTLVFTASRELAEEAQAAGATVISLDERVTARA
jgi:DNA repair exonuclease SbcCD ATPase subunit